MTLGFRALCPCLLLTPQTGLCWQYWLAPSGEGLGAPCCSWAVPGGIRRHPRPTSIRWFQKENLEVTFSENHFQVPRVLQASAAVLGMMVLGKAHGLETNSLKTTPRKGCYYDPFSCFRHVLISVNTLQSVPWNPNLILCFLKALCQRAGEWMWFLVHFPKVQKVD